MISPRREDEPWTHPHVECISSGVSCHFLRSSGRRAIGLLALLAALLMTRTSACAGENAPSVAASGSRGIPVIDVTDLYHPPQDPGDNFDLLAAYALPEVDLRAVILDCTEGFRKQVADDPRPGLYADAKGPRDPGFIPVLQLNYLFGRAVPCAAGPFRWMRSPEDQMRDLPAFQQQGVELLLNTLRQSAVPVWIVSFGSLRPIAVALNRDPKLLRDKVARILVCAGSSSPEFIEWNVALDPIAFARVMGSDLPIALYLCAAKGGALVVSPENTYSQLPDLRFIGGMQPLLRAYLDYAFGRVQRSDFLHVLDEGFARDFNAEIYARPFNVWETPVWQEITGRLLVRREDGTCRLIPPGERRKGDQIIPQGLVPCEWRVGDDGRLEVTTGKGQRAVYRRPDPVGVQQAWRDAVPALYRSFKTPQAP